jgi:DNA repair protein RadA/Sms
MLKSTAKSVQKLNRTDTKNNPISLKDVEVVPEEWVKSGSSELDLVLGKGFVKGGVVLLGGEPGIGKSTLTLQVAQHVASCGKNVLLVTGEESISQLQLRSRRLGVNTEKLMVLVENNVLRINDAIKRLKPDLLILDSIQVMFHPDMGSVSGSVAQVRYCASEIIQTVKPLNCATVLVGHITKDGQLAGPKVLEHLVDVILYFEGDRDQKYRLLRCFKNRYSSTQEIGIFEMKEDGLIGVHNATQLFIEQSTLNHSGSVVTTVSEGTRVMLVEIQALVVTTGYGMAKRTILGVDNHRANLMIAAMEKILGIALHNQDIILNVVGGMKIQEPAVDLAMILGIMSSLRDVALPEHMGVIGEVGLTGEVRSVGHIDRRVREFLNFGFKRCIIPKGSNIKGQLSSDIQIHEVAHISEAVAIAGLV